MNLDFLLTRAEPPILLAVILLEVLVSALARYPVYTWKDSAVNLIMTGFQFSIDLLMKGVSFAMLFFFWKHSFYHIQTAWVYWVVLFLLSDFAFYVLHCVDHYCRFFWAVHVTHHSSEHFNLTVGIRSSVFQPLYRSLYYIPLAMMGFQPVDVLFAYAIAQFYGTFVHTELVGKLGLLEYILVTPSHHRVHHASNPEYLDKNMGMCLIIWDKIFGTFQAELDDVKPEYGLTTKLNTYNPLKVVFHEWVSIVGDLKKPISWRYKLKYIFGPPGYSHDGSRMTSGQLREAKQKNAVQPEIPTEQVAEMAG